jgi:decaprenylphospho-beta-D-ribofuranose 2-oxidase
MTLDLAHANKSLQSAESSPTARRTYVSFDGGVSLATSIQQPDRYRYWDGIQDVSPRISRGAGLSYAAASFLSGGLSVSHQNFNRILDYDSVSHIVEVESGITLYELYKFLSSRGLYLPIQPGHGKITVGGCIAADTHGKNQYRDGTFINQVESIVLFHPSHGFLNLSRHNEPELFQLTCGGFGLTGHIISARLRTSLAPSFSVELRAFPISSINLGLKDLEDMAPEADFVYSWHDMTRQNKNYGDGFCYRGSFVLDDYDLMPVISELPKLTSESRASQPFSLVNKYSIGPLNYIYRNQQKLLLKGKKKPLHEVLFPIHKSQTYFELFGRAGFYEYQVVLPRLRLIEYLESIRWKIANGSVVISLCSAKVFSGTSNLLRFTGDGICLALNIPRVSGANEFMTFLDKQVILLGGIPNIIKDSRLPRAVIDACYLGADTFRSSLKSFDSKRIFRSEISERLGL